ncbi:MAG TPA: FCD domain-containing protein [Pseudonocardia sp.]|jgi:DNA-binding FadR family transcriptional regulator|nr:FCD domain-containing protein [Pseudonocardia sp.]
MAESQRPVRRGFLPTHTARRIIRDFLTRGLGPGEVLADEATLVERYGVSRGTLRESLRLLSFLGAVSVKAGPSGGPRLTTPGPEVVGSALGMVVQFRGATLRTVFEARLAVEPAVAALAAVNRKDVDLELLDESAAALAAVQRRPGPEYAEQAGRHMIRVAEASHNELLATIVPALAAMHTAVPWRYPKGSRVELTQRVHASVEAIRAGDGRVAGEITRGMLTLLIDDLESTQRAQLECRILWPDVDEVMSGEHYR